MSEFSELAGKTYYELFGIANDADYSAIKKAYDEEYRKYLTAKDQARWLRVSEGWEVLKDQARRADYDRKIKEQDRNPVLKVIRRMDEHYVYKNVKKGTVFTETIVIKNTHKGRLKGKIFSDAEWLAPDRDDLSFQHEQALDIHVLTSKIPANCYDAKGTVTIDTNGGLPYSIPFRVVLADIDVAAGKFRKTYVPVAVAGAGFIGSFSGLTLPLLLIGAVSAGAVFYAAAKFIVKTCLQNGLNIVKLPAVFIQAFAGCLAALALLFHSGFNPMPRPEKLDIPFLPENPPLAAIPQPEPLPAAPEPIIENHDRQANPADDGAPANETIALPGSVINIDSKTTAPNALWEFGFEAAADNLHYGFGCNSRDGVHFRINGNNADWTAGVEAVRTSPGRVTLYFRSADWNFIQKCSSAAHCEQTVCPLAIAVEPYTNPEQAPLAGLSSTTVNPGKTARKKNHPASRSVPKKKNRKPETSSFAPPSRDNL